MTHIEEAQITRVRREDGRLDMIVRRADGTQFRIENVEVLATDVDQETAQRVASAPRTEARN